MNASQKCLITDFDETFFNTSVSRGIRKAKDRDWNDVYALIPQFEMYDGWKELLTWLKDHNVKLAVVSAAKTELLKRTFAHFGIVPDAIVGFQWCYRKPNGKLIQMALDKLGMDASQAISIGNSLKDEIQAQKAGVKFVGACWDSLDKETLKLHGDTANHPMELTKFL